MNRKQKVELLHQALLLVLLLLALFSVKYLLDRQESVTAAAQKEQPEDTGESETSGEQIKEQEQTAQSRLRARAVPMPGRRRKMMERPRQQAARSRRR